jgi:uncharacterized protein
MKILITGASGLVGKRLQKSFDQKGYELLLATRGAPRTANEIRWNIENGFSDADLHALEGLDTVVHLAGENVSGWWTENKKKRILDSRVLGTRSVVEAIGKLQNKPKVLISASGLIYGDRGDEVSNEDSPAGDLFLSRVTIGWEAEAMKAAEFGTRVVMLRIGPVMAKDGGPLAEMMTPFRLGLGGVAGSGRQWFSWIAIDDLISVINFALENENVSGPINTVSPNPVTNREFTKALGRVLSRPTIFPLPEFLIGTVFGEMGRELLLASIRVQPKRLETLGFRFQYPTLDAALDHVLHDSP